MNCLKHPKIGVTKSAARRTGGGTAEARRRSVASSSAGVSTSGGTAGRGAASPQTCAESSEQLAGLRRYLLPLRLDDVWDGSVL